MSEPFRDPARSFSDRVGDLLGRLTLAEKVALLHQHQAPIPRLGVGGFRTGTEALHGLAWLGPATVFPQAVGLASTWDPELVRAVGEAVGVETRAFHHKDPTGAGLNVWAPVVNQLRDPRWGRNEEGYAEDPLLTGVMGTAYAGGLRGDHPRFLRTAPTVKHFLGYNNETRRSTTSSNLGPRVLREYELPAFRMPIEAGAAVAVMASYNLVNGRPAHLSPLINDVLRTWTTDDVLVVSDAQAPSNVVEEQGYYPDHAAGHAALLKAGVDSFTDNDDRSAITVERVTEALHRGLLTEADVDVAVRHNLAIRFRLGEFDPPEDNPYAGVSADVVNCPAHQELARRAAQESVVLLRNEGAALPWAAGSVARVAVLGPLADVLYEDWYSGTLPYAVTAARGIAERYPDAEVTSVEGVDRIALRAAGGGYVVAGQEPGGAPLRVVAGSGSTDPNSWFDVFDWGQGVRAIRAAANTKHVTVDAEGTLINDQVRPNGWVVRETFRLVYRPGGEFVLHHVATDCYVEVDHDGALRATATSADEATGFIADLVTSGLEEAVAAARAADVAVVVVGNHPLINGRETEDRVDLDLPPAQDELARAVLAANPRTVLVVQSSYPYGLGWADAHVPAILWSSHGGQEFGHGLAAILAGDASPAGRLTQTWYSSAADLPDLLDYDIIAADATYLYYRGTPLYPFGHGLSYTTFDYRDLRLSRDTVDAGASMAADEEVTVTVDVVNTGDRYGDEVVQLYTRQQRSRVKQPLRQLRGFQRIGLAPGERRTVQFTLKAADLAYWDVTQDRFVVEAARHTVMVGGSSTDIRRTAVVAVRGDQIPPRGVLAGPLAAVNHDEYDGVILFDESPVGGDAVGAAEPGAWISFADVSFDGPLAAVRIRVSRVDTGRAVVTLRLDDPVAGPVVAEVRQDCGPDRYAWCDAVVPVTAAPTGRHDLYVVLAEPGVNVAAVTFFAGTATLGEAA